MDTETWMSLRNLMGQQPTLHSDVQIRAGFIRKEEARDEATVYARALTKLGFGKEYGVFVRHVGGGAGWGIYLGPQRLRWQ